MSGKRDQNDRLPFKGSSAFVFILSLGAKEIIVIRRLMEYYVFQIIINRPRRILLVNHRGPSG